MPIRANGAAKAAGALIAKAAASAAPPPSSRRDETAATPSGREQHREPVVVGPADDVDEDQRVEGDEGRGAHGVDPPRRREPGDEQRRCRAPRAAAIALSTATAAPTGSQASG